MSISDEDKKGYIAIGEAVISHIFEKEEVSRESLILRLEKQAGQETDEDYLAEIGQARKILENLEQTQAPHGDNVVNLEFSRTAEQHPSSDRQLREEGDEQDEAKNG
ncbi:hypothetical protein CHU32_06515 [Superficieibacter electus]|uniref:Uncharacterized protein n=1 Tax=Superficieibacter electus TaxID=2022662 RepID=A0A2P5GTI9_9ENTR|nr:hypothetical protein [Superficieibacter electus]POP46399.1 hypothetical protein CHU33_06500 [Superficieibacter electus]POP49870.1 hypothetical protein CHU32_06515 [Superficieibacter electus]